jgi:biopolymer transport protein ExbD
MAIKLRDGDEELEVNHEINVTPFIDVILVLLIIFMVAAPLATVDIAVDLPIAAAPQQPRPDKPIYLTIKSDFGLLVGDEALTLEDLRSTLDRVTGADKDQRVFLRADKTVDYDHLMQVMNALRGAGYLKVALVGLDAGAAP